MEDDDVEEDDNKDNDVAEDEVEDDVAENEVEVDDVEDDEVKGEEDDDAEKADVEEDLTIRWWCWGVWCWGGKTPGPGPTLCASLRNRNALEPRDTEMYRKHARAQKRDADFVRACAVEVHLDIWKEPLCAEIYRCAEIYSKKSPSPESWRRLCVSLRSRNALGHFTKATLCRNLQTKCPSPEPRRRLCASLRSRNARGHCTKATLYWNLKGKRPQTKSKQNSRRKLCASLHSRNALGDFTWATMRKFIRKMPWPRVSTSIDTGLYHYCKNPSVWTRCLGKKNLSSKLGLDLTSLTSGLNFGRSVHIWLSLIWLFSSVHFHTCSYIFQMSVFFRVSF